MIGLVDLQLQSWAKPQLCPPNLEIMKLATYYKGRENIFCKLVNLEETELSGYEKIYIYSENLNYINVPEAFRRADNVIYGGTAFTNGIYIPFENELIDYTIARPNIYTGFIKEKINNGMNIKMAEHILDDTYYRMQINNKYLPTPPILPKKRVYLYDKNIFIPKWQNIFEKISEHNPSNIIAIHPIHCHTIKDFFALYSFSKFSRANTVILDMNIPLEDTSYLMKTYKLKFLSVLTPSSNIYITLGGNFSTKIQYEKDLIYKLNLLYIFWSNNIPIKIKYITPKIGYCDPVKELSQLISIWSQNESRSKKTIIEKIPKDKHTGELRPERASVEYLIKTYPKSKNLFHQTFDELRAKGVWRYEY